MPLVSLLRGMDGGLTERQIEHRGIGANVIQAAMSTGILRTREERGWTLYDLAERVDEAAE